MTHTMRTVSIAAAMIGAFSLAGCSTPPPADSAPKATQAPTTAPKETAAAKTAPTEAGNRPAWAVNPLDVGTLVGEGGAGDWQVQVYEVGDAVTATDGIWAMPETNEPVMPAGTEMTLYNFVITNTGDTVQRLSGTEATMIQHDGVEDYAAVLRSSEDELFTQLGLSRNAYDLAALDSLPVYGDEKAYEVAPGESFAVAESTWAVPGTLQTSVSLNVMDEQGKRLVDKGAIIDIEITQK